MKSPIFSGGYLNVWKTITTLKIPEAPYENFTNSKGSPFLKKRIRIIRIVAFRSRRGSPPREEESTNATEPENCGGSHGTSFASSDSSEVVGTLEEMLASRDTTIGEDEVAYIVSPCVQKLSLLHE